MDEIVENKIDIDGVDINYAKVGHGNVNLLCLSGAIGCWNTDFKDVLEKYDHDKFTLVAWDPPGYGKSRPPDRDFSHGTNARDATKAHKLMLRLDLVPYSILGWSDGGITALHIAHQQRKANTIQKMVVWGSSAYVTSEQVKVYKVLKDPNNWANTSRQPFLDLYGEEYFIWAWQKHIDTRLEIFNKYAGDKCKAILPEIPQPVLIIHGTRDVFLTKEHPVYLSNAIPNAKMEIHRKAGHAAHKEEFDWFKNQVETFLLRNKS